MPEFLQNIIPNVLKKLPALWEATLETLEMTGISALFILVLGMALGILLGKWFHAYLITTVEVELVMFGREAHPLSYVLALALTILFALLVNLAAGRKLRKIDMVESLKTVE